MLCTTKSNKNKMRKTMNKILSLLLLTLAFIYEGRVLANEPSFKFIYLNAALKEACKVGLSEIADDLNDGTIKL